MYNKKKFQLTKDNLIALGFLAQQVAHPTDLTIGLDVMSIQLCDDAPEIVAVLSRIIDHFWVQVRRSGGSG